MAMEIGIVTDCLDSGLKAGTQRYTLQLVRSLLSLDKKDSFTLVHGTKSDLDIYSQPNVRELLVWKPFKQVLKELFVTPLALMREEFDVLHLPSQVAPFHPKPTAKLISTILDLTPVLLPHTHRREMVLEARHLLPRLLRQSDAIIAISESTKRDAVKHYRIPAEKIHVTYCGVGSEYCPRPKGEVKKATAAHNINSPYILHVGSLEPRKNIPTLLKAFAELKRKPEFKEFKLVLVGAKAWHYKGVFETIGSLGIAKDVIMPGFVRDEELPALYSGASVFVYSSLYEGFGLPPLEAMASGCPVITSNTSSLPEVVGNAGIMLDPGDAYSFADAIAQVLTDGRLAESMAKKGLERAKKFTWEKCAKETLKIYGEVVE